MKNPNPLYGALGGDFVGSICEPNNIKTKDFPLIDSRCKLTDVSILTMATAYGICMSRIILSTIINKAIKNASL